MPKPERFNFKDFLILDFFQCSPVRILVSPVNYLAIPLITKYIYIVRSFRKEHYLTCYIIRSFRKDVYYYFMHTSLRNDRTLYRMSTSYRVLLKIENECIASEAQRSTSLLFLIQYGNECFIWHREFHLNTTLIPFTKYCL